MRRDASQPHAARRMEHEASTSDMNTGTDLESFHFSGMQRVFCSAHGDPVAEPEWLEVASPLEPSPRSLLNLHNFQRDTDVLILGFVLPSVHLGSQLGEPTCRTHGGCGGPRRSHSAAPLRRHEPLCAATSPSVMGRGKSTYDEGNSPSLSRLPWPSGRLLHSHSSKTRQICYRGIWTSAKLGRSLGPGRLFSVVVSVRSFLFQPLCNKFSLDCLKF